MDERGQFAASPSKGQCANTAIESPDDGAFRSIHLWALVLCGCVLGMDLMEMALGSAYGAIFSTVPNHMSATALTMLLCAAYAGSVIGAPLLGSLGDTFGVRMALRLGTLWLAAASLMAGISQSTTSLIVWRALSGIALGGLPPLVIAYMSDIAPRGSRGRMVFTMCALAYCAPPAGMFMLHELTPRGLYGVDAWRWPLLCGALLSLATGVLFRTLPEAPDWLASAGWPARSASVRSRILRSRILLQASHVTALSPNVATLSTGPGSSGTSGARLLFFSAVSGTIGGAAVSFPLITGTLLLARHVRLSDTLLYMTVSTFGPMFATMLAGARIDRIGRRASMAIFASAMLAAMVLFVLTQEPFVMGASMVVASLATSLYMPTLTTFGAELFEPEIRARATSIGWLMNRTAGTVVPACLIPLSRGANGLLVTGMVLSTMLLVNLALLFFGAGWISTGSRVGQSRYSRTGLLAVTGNRHA